MTLLIGLGIYNLIWLQVLNDVIRSLEGCSKEIAGILSSYAFTIAGFLATIATFLFTLGDRPYFELYRRRGSFGDLMFLHAMEMIILGSLFICSISLVAFPSLIRLALTLSIVSLLHLTFLTFISYNLSKRSNG